MSATFRIRSLRDCRLRLGRQAIAAMILVTIASCGTADSPRNLGPETTDESGPLGPSAEVRTPHLKITPTSVHSGQSLVIAVANWSSDKLYFGLANEVQRQEGSSWVSVDQKLFGFPSRTREIRLSAGASQKVGPEYDGLIDEIRLSSEVPAGVYRVTKDAAVGSAGRDMLKLVGQFEVR